MPRALWGFKRGGTAMWMSETNSMASVEGGRERQMMWIGGRLSGGKRCRCGGGASAIVAGRQRARETSGFSAAALIAVDHEVSILISACGADHLVDEWRKLDSLRI